MPGTIGLSEDERPDDGDREEDRRREQDARRDLENRPQKLTPPQAHMVLLSQLVPVVWTLMIGVRQSHMM